MCPRKLCTRSLRYPAVIARTPAASTPVAANDKNTFTGKPANHSSAPTMTAMVMVVLRFGSRMMSTQTKKETGISGTSNSRSDALSRRRDANR